MTKEELIIKLKNCNSGDEEIDHVNADRTLLEYINDEEVTKTFHDIDKWYA